MRKCLLLLSIAALPLFAESIATTVRFDIKELSLSVTDGGDVVELAGYPALVQPGMPRLPRVVQTVVIPAGAEPTGVEVTEVEWQPVPGRFNVVPAQPDVPLPMPGKSFALPNVARDAAVYSSTAPYPAAVVRLLDAGTMNGYRLAHVELRPVRYIPGTGELLLATRISYQLEYARSAEVGTVPTQAQLEEAGRRLRQLVVNPGDVSRFAPRVSRSALSTLPPGNYPYVIISAPPVDTCFQRLADWKTRKGVPATVVTVSYIAANYTGTDTQTKIRNFIIDAYQTWGTNYVLLGGSGDQKNSGQNLVPARRCYYTASGAGYYSDEDMIPCDLYYGGLDGTWNADGDTIWGERTDNADMYADVHVGRASVYTVAQAQNFVNKVLTYEQNPPTNYVRKMLLPAAILWSSYNERPTQESIARMTPTEWLDAKLYERTSTLSRTRMRDSMNSGFGMGHWVGHGDEYGIYMGSSPYLNSSDAQTLTNGDKIGVHASIACFTGAWDEVPSGGDCFAEHLMNRVGGGTAAVLMNSRYGWGAYIPGTGYVFGPSERLDTTFCSAVLNQNNFRVGPALTYAKSSWVPYADSTGRYDMMRWCIYELNIFGDPELPIWTDEPATLTVAHAGTITTGMNLPYTVTVTTGASVPLESARVVLWKGNEVYASGLTNASGQVILLVSPQTVGTMLLTVTKRNYRPHLGTVNVTAGPTYDVGCATILVPSGTIDSGTVVTPACTVANYGTGTASYTVRMKIGAAYNQTATVTNQPAGARTYVTFPAWTATGRGSFSVSCSTELGSDVNQGNDKQTGSVMLAVRDVGCAAIVAPSGTIDSGTVVTPACTVANYGTGTASYTVRMKIGAAYNQAATVTNQPAGARTYVTFPAWTATSRGSFSVSCSTELAGDGVASNDKQTGTVTVVVRDIEVMAILAPTGTVDSGTVITPQATVRNNGTAAATFTVQLTIAGGSYSNTQTVTNLAAGAAQTVTFANWTALPRGGPYAVNCVAVLTGDMVPANNSANGSVTVAVRDVGCSVLLAPSGTVDSGTVVTPACTVANYGTGPASYTVRMRIGASYEQTAVVTNQPAGARTYVTFPVWTATGRGTFAVTCSTEYGNDMVSDNDKQTGNVTLAVRDVGCLAILAPLGMIDSGTVVTPACSVVNYGASPATYTVRMQIGADYDEIAQVTSQAPGARSLILFPAWTAQRRGGFAVSCATEYSDDMVPDNNTASQAGLVAVHDAAVTAVTWPVGAVPPGPLVPTAMLSNRGNLREPVRVFCSINSLPSYQDSVVLAAGLPVGLDTVISFSPWLASFGDYVVRCSVALVTEQQPANNVTGHSFHVIGLPDVGCAAIVAPTGTIDTATAVVPKAWVRNWGSVTASLDVVCRIQRGTTTVHSDTQFVAALGSGESLLVSFAAWPQPHQPGRYLVACSTRWVMDSVPTNDRVETEFLVTVGQTVTGWQPAESLPSSVPVREGGALCCDQEWQMVFSLLGNRTREFFGFDPYSGRWTQLPPMPAGASNRPVARGGALCAGGGQVYALKGNSTREFYRYDPATGTWTELEPVPLALDQSATRGRPVRAGASLAYVSRNDSGFVYVLKGYGTEFYRYDVASDTHVSLGSVPYSTQPRYDKGSWLVYDGSRYLYLLQGRYNALFRYDVGAEQWVTAPALTPMPFNSSRPSNKKSGDGGCASSDGRVIYALKGNNTQEFWQYRPGTTGDTWVELETIPRSMFPGGQRKKVRYGGGIAYFAPTGVLYAQKGNSSRQFWVYTPARTVLAQRPQRDGVQAEEAVNDDSPMRLGPNPLRSGFLNLSIGAFSQPVTISIHDALGRSVLTRQLGVGRSGTRATLDLRALPAGVYLVRLDRGDRCESRKLVIEE